MNTQKNIYWGILLAAGASSRMIDWKPAIELNGRALLFHSLDTLLKVCEKVIIVGGYNYEKLEKLICANYKYDERVIIVQNIEYSFGMLSSVQTGLKEIKQETDAIFILPADIPFVKESTYSGLKKSSEENNESDVFIPTVEITDGENIRQKKGHPVLIKSKFISHFLNYDNNKTLRDAIKELRVYLYQVEDKGILFDIDEKKDLEQASEFKY